MTVLDHTTERFFEGYLTVEMKDRQGEITVVDELYKCLPIWMDRGAPITDTHSNRVVGKGINFMKTTVESEGVTYPAIKITGKIHKDYELDADIWEKIKSGEYKGLSFGGATKSNRTPKVMKDGSIAYELKDLEHYEVAVCRDPAVPLALITDYNPLAKALTNGEDIGNGKMKIKCGKFGCYVTKVDLDKGEDFSNADLLTGTSTQDIDAGGMGKNNKLKPTKLDGGLPDLKTTIKIEAATTGAGTGVRGLGNTEAQNQNSPEDNTIQNTVTVGDKEDITKIVGEVLAGAGRALATGAKFVGDVADGAAKVTVDETLDADILGTDTVENTDKSTARSLVGATIEAIDDSSPDTTEPEFADKKMTYRNTPANVEMTYPEEGEDVWDSKQQKEVKEDKTPKRSNQLESKSGYETNQHNVKLGEESIPKKQPKTINTI
jgi:hypothetical protein